MAENTKGNGYPDNPVGHKTSPTDFAVRDADEVELRDTEIKRQADVDSRVEQLRREKS